jgi:uncharacterized protein (TIGR03067 family)
MRSIAFISTLVFCFGFTGIQNTPLQSNKLNGIWIPTKQEMGGSALPATSFATQKLIIKDTTYTVIAESLDQGIVSYNGNNKMDIYGKDGPNAGKHFTAIYKYENGQLTICYNLRGDTYPESFETKEKPLFFLSVFKKDITN